MNGQRRLSLDDEVVRAGSPWVCRGLIGGQAGVYATVTYLSRRFDYASDFQQRPILFVLLLLAVAFALHILSLSVALRSANQADVTRKILLGSVLFRVILLPSPPIQEVDIYRYLWDGAVVAAGGNPYHLSPLQVLTASRRHDGPTVLDTLVDLKSRSAACEQALRRIHYRDLITVYPPVSQAVFGMASYVVPDTASLFQRLVTMKIVMTLFDLMTIWLLIAILRCVGRHAGWAIVYAWSPLVLKEFANSGHLDSIAVCLTTGAVFFLLQVRVGPNAGSRLSGLIVSALLLGLGIGAKLYPVVLIPVLALWTAHTCGQRAGAVYVVVSLVCGMGCVSPMLLTKPVTIEVEQPALPEHSHPMENATAGSGLATFLSRWEINDLLFLIIVENLRPDAVDTPPHWFVIAPSAWRISTAEFLSSTLQRPISEATFLTARGITLLMFAAIAAGLLGWTSNRNEEECWLRAVFLTIAWFWVLAPTLNPWYWTWAIPFLPFARRWAWSGVSLLVLAYYLRFWLLYQFPDAALLGTGYRGEQFFHYVVAPLEHGLWLLWLSAETFVFQRVWPHSQTDYMPAC